MPSAIINNRIAGTRVSVYAIVPYLEDGNWSHEAIAEILSLSIDQVRAAVQYIEANRDQVMAVHRRIEKRNARGNTAEIEAKREISRAKLQEVHGAGHPRG